MVVGSFVALEVSPGLHRIELPAAALSIPAPPTYTELAMRMGRGGFEVTALAGREQAAGIERWLRELGADRIQMVGGREPGVKGRMAGLPEGLAFAAGLMDVRRVGLGSDGSAFVLAAGTRGKFEEVVRHLESRRMPQNAVPELTARQAELLQFCKDKGYYEIPRQATLRGLAGDLGISPTALSKALRRAEARILSAYVERLRHSLPRQPPTRRTKRSA